MGYADGLQDVIQALDGFGQAIATLEARVALLELRNIHADATNGMADRPAELGAAELLAHDPTPADQLELGDDDPARWHKGLHPDNQKD